MKRMLTLMLALAAMCGPFAAAVAEKAAPSVNGALHVSGGRLTDEHGDTVQLTGISTHGLAWFPQYVNEACFVQLRDGLGCSVIRLAMYTASYGGYCTGGDREQLKQLILDGVDYAEAADMYVIVDWHVLPDLDPNVYADEAVAFFDEISRKLSGKKHVIYEICNEPNGSTTWADIKAYAARVIPVIRANAPDAVILVGTPCWSQEILDAAADPLDFDNIMYTLHFYAATHKEELRSAMETALEQGVPVFVSEYGTCCAEGSTVNDFESADAWVELMDRYQVSNVMWNLSNSGELSSVFKRSFAGVSGFTTDDLNDCAIWLAGRLGGTLAD